MERIDFEQNKTFKSSSYYCEDTDNEMKRNLSQKAFVVFCFWGNNDNAVVMICCITQA